MFEKNLNLPVFKYTLNHSALTVFMINIASIYVNQNYNYDETITIAKVLKIQLDSLDLSSLCYGSKPFYILKEANVYLSLSTTTPFSGTNSQIHRLISLTESRIGRRNVGVIFRNPRRSHLDESNLIFGSQSSLRSGSMRIRATCIHIDGPINIYRWAQYSNLSCARTGDVHGKLATELSPAHP